MGRFFFYISFYLIFTQASFAKYDHVETRFEPHKRWLLNSKLEQQGLRNLLKTLIRSKTGKNLVRMANQKAKDSGLTLYDVIKPGNGSLTDTTLTRKFSTNNLEQVNYETVSLVFINKELNQYDALLDLAHELTHYVYREGFNPYIANFTLKDFITNTIEGQGGEVQAFMTECMIQKELFPYQRSGRYNCNNITDANSGKISLQLAIQNFYKVGKYFDSFNSVLKEHGIRKFFPEISAQKASFVSSAYGIPYPVAAFEEYLSVLNKACANDKKRLLYFKQQKGRAPASVAQVEKSYNSRCYSFN